MASIILSSVISDMVSQVISMLTSQFRSRRSMEAKLLTMHLQGIKIQSAVEEAAGRQITSQGLLDWLSELINGVYQGRYMLDMVRYGVAEAADPTGGNGDENSPSFFLSLYNPAKRLRVAVHTTKTIVLINNDVAEVDHVLAKLDLICTNLKEFIMLLGIHPPLVHRHISTNLYVDCQMLGRHVERERIINILVHENRPIGQKLRILPIIGHNGVGKSTLVQQVCADARVQNYFSPVLLFGSYFIHSMVDAAIERNSDDPVQVLKEKLCGQRFLIVFQNIDLQHAEQFKAILPSLMTGKHGSQMIITSSNKHVASIGTTKPIILRDLPPAEYWFFFKAHAFCSRDLEEDHKLMTIGRAIARRLNGSFWAAKIVGGLLRANPTPRLWWKVANCDAWKLSLHGSGLGYINDVTSQLLLPDIKTHHNFFSSTLAPNCRTQLRLPSFCNRNPADESLSSGDKSEDGRNSSILDILLCKSIFPFYNLYLIAHCTMQ